MIDTNTLQTKANRYKARCQVLNIKPTNERLGHILGISGRTVANVRKEEYNGKQYGQKPSVMRCVANDDFKIIQGVFE